MTVDQLKRAIAHVPGHLVVEISLTDVTRDEVHATALTMDRTYLRICETDKEISRGDTVLLNDHEGEEG